MLEIRDLCKKYGSVQALDHLSLHISEGELFGFVGENGAGKTTTMRILSGLLRPDGGKIQIQGKDVGYDTRTLRDQIGYVPDSFGIYDNIQVYEYMEFFAAAYGMTGLMAARRCRELLDLTGLYAKEKVYVDSLSRGMKQRLAVARALIHHPKLLILDEPASGLDPRNRQEFISLLKEIHGEGTTIFISSHILSELSEMCTSIGILDQGKILLSGTMEEIAARMNQRNPIEIQVLEGQEKAIAFLKQYELIHSITADGNRIQVQLEGGEEEECFLLESMIRAGIPIRRFGRKERGLEDLFMEVTRQESSKVVAKE